MDITTKPTVNPVIGLIEDGHIASFKGTDMHEPQACKKCGTSWPCLPIIKARKQHALTAPRLTGTR